VNTLPDRSVMLEGLHAGIDVITELRERIAQLPPTQLNHLLKIWPEHVNLKEGRCTLVDAYEISDAVMGLEAKAELSFPDYAQDVDDHTIGRLVDAATVLAGDGYEMWVDVCCPLPGTAFTFSKPETITNQRHAEIALMLARIIEPHWREVLASRVPVEEEEPKKTKATRKPRKPRGGGEAGAAPSESTEQPAESVGSDATVETSVSPDTEVSVTYEVSTLIAKVHPDSVDEIVKRVVAAMKGEA
jgi:hypothetical protein